ncbi:MAG: guanylate cyclase [Polaromonas sp.]|jgi:hypothetical protein|nr:guanylate cyclase [Polaromonas sp.]MDB5845760.1 guanylate cyclase [Polaromonas sp.]
MALHDQQEIDQQLAQFRLAFERGGLLGALGYLNARTSFRFTAIYRLDGQMMRNIHLYDRLGEYPVSLSEVPLGESFCQFVLRNNGFSTADSAGDARLDGHPQQGVMNSYFGLPLSRRAGTIYGTLCHFDVEPMMLPDSEIFLLEAVSPVLMDQLG